MDKVLTPIKNIFKMKNYFFLFIISSFLYGIVFSMMTNLIDIRFGLSNFKFVFTWKSSLFLIILSLLGGLLIALQIFSFREKQKNYTSTTTGIGGMLISFFATTCPFCKPLLISLLGLSGSLIISKYGSILAIISILLLSGSIYFTLINLKNKNNCPKCKKLNTKDKHKK